jgi:hypothetical protein
MKMVKKLMCGKMTDYMASCIIQIAAGEKRGRGERRARRKTHHGIAFLSSLFCMLRLATRMKCGIYNCK